MITTLSFIPVTVGVETGPDWSHPVRSCEVCEVPLKSRRAWRCVVHAREQLGIKTRMLPDRKVHRRELTHVEVAAAVAAYLARGGQVTRLRAEVVVQGRRVAVHAPTEYEEFCDVDATFPVAAHHRRPAGPTA